MSGYEDLNFPAFQHAATLLRDQGYDIRSPHENEAPDGVGDWVEYMRLDIKTIADCDGIVLLRGWAKSKGAQLELSIALALGLTVRFFNERTGELLDTN